MTSIHRDNRITIRTRAPHLTIVGALPSHFFLNTAFTEYSLCTLARIKNCSASTKSENIKVHKNMNCNGRNEENIALKKTCLVVLKGRQGSRTVD